IHSVACPGREGVRGGLLLNRTLYSGPQSAGACPCHRLGMTMPSKHDPIRYRSVACQQAAPAPQSLLPPRWAMSWLEAHDAEGPVGERCIGPDGLMYAGPDERSSSR